MLTYFESPENKIHALCDALSITAIYTQKEWTREEVTTDNLIKSTLSDTVHFTADYDQFLYHPEAVSNDFSKIPDVFTIFRKKLEKTVKIEDVFSASKLPKENLISTQTAIPKMETLGFSDFEAVTKTAFPFAGGETAAFERLQDYFFEKKSFLL